MKTVLLVFFLLTQLSAYQKGDIITEAMASHLGLENNKVYVIDFFASWCGSCQKELPRICTLDSRINHGKVEIIGIDVDQKVSEAMAFQQALKSEHHLNFKIVNDPQNLIISEFSPLGMPTLYYVKNRKVLKIITGAVEKVDRLILEDLKSME